MSSSRYSDRELVKQIVGKENVEYPEKVSILDSISNMDTAIGLYTTVLNQAYHCGKNVIIDDVTYPSEVKNWRSLSISWYTKIAFIVRVD